jgi:hypothetical protein
MCIDEPDKKFYLAQFFALFLGLDFELTRFLGFKFLVCIDGTDKSLLPVNI